MDNSRLSQLISEYRQAHSALLARMQDILSHLQDDIAPNRADIRGIEQDLADLRSTYDEFREAAVSFGAGESDTDQPARSYIDRITAMLSARAAIEEDIAQLHRFCSVQTNADPDTAQALAEVQKEAWRAAASLQEHVETGKPVPETLRAAAANAATFLMSLTAADPAAMRQAASQVKKVYGAEVALGVALGQYFLPQAGDIDLPKTQTELAAEPASSVPMSVSSDGMSLLAAPHAEARIETDDGETPQTPAEPTFENLGITDPAALTFSVPDSAVHVRESTPKAFSIKVFRKDFAKNQNEFMKRVLLLMGAHTPWALPDSAAKMMPEDDPHRLTVAAYEAAAEELLQKGYLREITVNGLGQVYSLTERGRGIFRNREGRNMLDLPTSGEYLEPEEVALSMDPKRDRQSRVASHRAYATMRELFGNLGPSRELTVSRGADGFVLRYPEVNEETSDIACTTCHADTPEEFAEYLARVEHGMPQDMLIVLQPEAEQARAVACWLRERLGEIALPEFLYGAYGVDTVYNKYDEPVEIPPWAVGEAGDAAPSDLPPAEPIPRRRPTARDARHAAPAHRRSHPAFRKSSATAGLGPASGIKPPEKLRLSISSENVHIYEKPAQHLSVEKLTSGPGGKTRLLFLLTAARAPWASSEYIHTVCTLQGADIPGIGELEQAADEMLGMGYLRRCKVDGVGSVYTLSESALEVVNSPQAEPTIDPAQAAEPEPYDLQLPDDPILGEFLRVAYHRANIILRELFPDTRSGMSVCTITGPGGLVETLTPHNKRGRPKRAWAVCYARSEADFTDFFDNVRKNLPSETLLILQPTLEQAAAGAGWLREQLGNKLKTKILYGTFLDSTLYGADGQPVHKRQTAALKGGPENRSARLDSSAEKTHLARSKHPQPVDASTRAAKRSEADRGGSSGRTGGADGAPVPRTKDEPGAVSTVQAAAAMPDALPVQTAPTEEPWDTALSMLAEDKGYCALPYLKTLGRTDPRYETAYRQLAHALDDPAFECSYRVSNLINLYAPGMDEWPTAVRTAALLRSLFLNSHDYEHRMDELWEIATGITDGDEDMIQPVRRAMYILRSFKEQYGAGADLYAGYRQPEREAGGRELQSIVADARNLHDAQDSPKETIRNRRVLETRRILTAPDSPTGRFLDAVSRDDRSVLEELRTYLTETYLVPGEPIGDAPIDPRRIENAVDDAWNSAGRQMMERKVVRLTGKARTSLEKQLRRIVALLCRYTASVDACAAEDSDRAAREYRKIRDELQASLTQALDAAGAASEDMPVKQRAGRAVLRAAVRDILDRIDGTYEPDRRTYFYLPFVTQDEILLDDEYMPMLEEVQEVESLAVLRRLERHAAAKPRTLEERLLAIHNAADDWNDLGSAGLIRRYLRAHPDEVSDPAVLDLPDDIDFADPEGFLENAKEDFMSTLDLAQHDGQMDYGESERREVMRQVVSDWCEWTLETRNYGFCRKVLSGMRESIVQSASKRADALRIRLEEHRAANPDWARGAKGDAAREVEKRIELGKYTAAEDLLNRLNDRDLDDYLAKTTRDYLQEFLDGYQTYARMAGSASKSVKRQLEKSGKNKEVRGGQRLVNAWPTSPGAGSDRIQSLLEGLGFPTPRVSEDPRRGAGHYLVQLEPDHTIGRAGQRQHPVAVFGSEAEQNGFRVAAIYGKMNAKDLVTTFDDLGDAKNTLVLLDYALTLAERRALARLTKSAFRNRTFMVLDRVALMYLAHRYSPTAVNDMLMSIGMPFSAGRLYQPDSGQEMPPELFIGRAQELAAIKAADGANIVYGGRQLGKTALLRKAQQDIDGNENGDRAVWVDIKGCDTERAAVVIADALVDAGILNMNSVTDEAGRTRADWDVLTRALKKRLRDKKDRIPYLLLLLDEADAFIKSSQAEHYRPFDKLKDVQGVGRGRFKFVVAGLHNVARFYKGALHDNIGLTHLGVLNVTPFKYREARQLLEEPLSYLGFRFPDNAATARLESAIFAKTNYFPGLIQLYGAKLIETLNRSYGGYAESVTPPYEVTEELIKKVLQDKSLLQQIQEKFDITVKVDKGEDDYYHLIALLAAYHSQNADNQEGFTKESIEATAREFEIGRLTALPTESLEALMDEMTDLNIFNRTEDGHYRFAYRHFLEMMGTLPSIEDEILEYGIREEAAQPTT